jgi:hypothetical protein
MAASVAAPPASPSLPISSRLDILFVMLPSAAHLMKHSVLIF